MTERIQEFLRNRRSEGQDTEPCLVVDLEVVRDNYQTFSKALPDSRVFYAVKANPSPEVLQLLASMGSCFDTATVAEIEMALTAGATPDRISYGNTIKKERDIARAFALGIRLFAVDCAAEVEKIARAAPGSKVFCRILYDCAGAEWPLSRKFGCDPEMAVDVLDLAKRLGLEPCGISFHVGSQQRKVKAWDRALSMASTVFRDCAERGINLSMVNMGGGFPTKYLKDVPPVVQYGRSIFRALRKHFGNQIPETIIEPGRGMVGNAGIIETEVVLISRKSDEDEVRWVYLDIGKFGGLAETMDESIRYAIRTPHDGADMTPCDARDRRQAADRRHRGLYVDLLVGGVQRHPAAADLPHLIVLTSPACGGRDERSSLLGRIASRDAIRVGEALSTRTIEVVETPPPRPSPASGRGSKKTRSRCAGSHSRFCEFSEQRSAA